MTNRFRINFVNPKNLLVKIYMDEPSEDSITGFVHGYVKKLPNAAESTDWVFVENHESQNMDGAFHKGWMKTWAIGERIPDVPQIISARALTFTAVANELDDTIPPEKQVAAEFLLALFFVENQIDPNAEPVDDLELSVKDTAPNPDYHGGFAVTSAQWDSFIAAEGERLNWSGDFLRELVLPQMRCAYWLAHRNQKQLGVAFGATPTEPFVPRMLDLFLAHLIGDVAAAAVIEMERTKTDLNKKIRTIIRDANSWSDDSPELKKLFENRSAFVGDLNGTGGGLTSVTQFLEACRTALDPALKLARKMLDAYLPAFAGNAMNGDALMATADAELAKWNAGWSEQVDPGKSVAIKYFEATDYTPAVVIDPTTNELTHWCGAFVAHCMKESNLPVPKSSAAAASWRNWGDMSLDKTQGSVIPRGAVITKSGGEGSNHIGHVTLFDRWDNDGQSFWGCGGNQSDSVTSAKFATDEIVAVRVIANRTQSTDKDLEILSKTLWGEIRGGTKEHATNVAEVVLNRFLSGYRSDGSIAGVCLKHKQFSCWNPGTKSLRSIEDLDAEDPELKRLMAFAKEVITRRLADPNAPAPLQGARHYHNHDVNPDWAIPAKIVKDDGKHVFYKDIA
ncbi:cell wall hydrolase [Tateyamaria sp. SN3-11]|uniref:cell wall hydrolase n=1 Tax=Tateyamaria sp. SN3-11 TaxID=3092147 RepID=UPI0039E8CFD6